MNEPQADKNDPFKGQSNLRSKFYIQPGHPKVIRTAVDSSDTIADVFQKIFSENDESMYMFWSDIPIRFHYTFEFCMNLERLSTLLDKICKNPEGQEQFVLLTDALVGNWSVNWGNNEIAIDASWKGRPPFEGYASALNGTETLKCSKDDFMAEWKLPFIQVMNALDDVKAIGMNKDIDEIIQKMGSVLQATDHYGVQYDKKR